MEMNRLNTPVYLIDEKRLRRNLELLHDVETKSGAKILLAQKAYSVYQTYGIISEYISGATASGLYEAKLAYDEMPGIKERKLENHVFEPAFKDDEMAELCQIADHIVFNSIAQLEHHRTIWEKSGISVGLRINPEVSTQEGHEIYDPCAAGSRLGIRLCDMPDRLPDGVEGLHFHTLCEQGFEPLLKTYRSFEERFENYLKKVKWLNLGGGHHITKDDYDRQALIELVKEIKSKYGIEVYLEPGEAAAIDAGYLITTVMDVVNTERYPVLILDTSAACHMPDVLEMPYRPPLSGAFEAEEKPYTYRLSSRTCLAGDVIGDYSFEHEIKVGDRLVFEDMAIYSMVKNNTFNGMSLPDIALMHEDGNCEIIKHFGYEDFKMRL